MAPVLRFASTYRVPAEAAALSKEAVNEAQSRRERVESMGILCFRRRGSGWVPTTAFKDGRINPPSFRCRFQTRSEHAPLLLASCSVGAKAKTYANLPLVYGESGWLRALDVLA